MSGSRWDQPGVPHKGWRCVDVVDLRANGEPADDTDYATCQMCGNEKIRYVHIMDHPDRKEAQGPIRADLDGRTLALLRRSCHRAFDRSQGRVGERVLCIAHDSRERFDGALSTHEPRQIIRLLQFGPTKRQRIPKRGNLMRSVRICCELPRLPLGLKGSPLAFSRAIALRNRWVSIRHRQLPVPEWRAVASIRSLSAMSVHAA